MIFVPKEVAQKTIKRLLENAERESREAMAERHKNYVCRIKKE